MENILKTENPGREFDAHQKQVSDIGRGFSVLKISAIESHKSHEVPYLPDAGKDVYYQGPETFGLINAELLSFLKRKGLDSITNINCVI